MAKNLIVSSEDKKVSNTFAGIALLITLGVLYWFFKPADVLGYVINIAIALVVGGIVYIIAEFIRKKRSK